MADAILDATEGAKSVAAPEASKKGKKIKMTPAMEKIHSEALERWDDAYDADRENIKEAYADLKFYGGDQWPATARKEREGESRPCLTVNKLPQFAKQITGDIRLSKPSIKVVPVDDESDPATAEVYEGLIRNIENSSDGRRAYYVGMDSQVTAGIGHWRIEADYCADDTLEQELKIKAIKNGVGVLWDPDAQEATRSDAMYCFVPDEVSRDKFEEMYPDASVDEMPTTDVGTDRLWWFTTDSIRISEYWVKEPITKTLAVLMDGKTLDVTDMEDPDVIAQISVNPIKRTVKRDGFKVVQYLISGTQILDGPNEWKGKYIPVVPVLGEEVFLEQRTIRLSAIRNAKDPQQLYNFFCSAQAEYIASQPKAPWIGTETNFKKHAKIWAEANRKNLPYLPYSPDQANGNIPPQRSQPPVGSPGFDESMARASEDLKATTGIYDASLGNKSNETSGKAILARQREGDTANFVFYDNFNRAVAHTGRIIIDLIPHYYDTARIVRVVGKDGAEKFLKINAVQGPDGQPIMGPDGMPITQFDMQAGKYDLVMDTGPSFASRRDEARDGMERLMQAAPQAAVFFMDLYAKALDWPFADEIGERLKALRPPDPGQMPPEQQAEEQAKKQAMDELQYKGAAAEVSAKEAEANLKNAQAQKAMQPEPAQPQEAGDQIEHETAYLKKEAARLSALAAYYTAEASVQAVLNPPQEVPPMPVEQPPMDPMVVEADHIGKQAAHTKAQAELINAQAALHSAQNPVDKDGKPLGPPPKKGPKNTRRMIKKIHRGPDGSISGADIADEEIG